jgi:hypothetical protein
MKNTKWTSHSYSGQMRRFNNTPFNKFCRCITAITAIFVLVFILPVMALADVPSIVASCDTPGFALGIAQGGNYSYVADGGGLQIIDITNPKAPYIKGYCSTPGTAREVALSENYIYMADHTAGLQIIDVSSPDEPTIVGSSPGYAFGIAHAGNYVYVANHDYGLQVIDVSTPTSPTIVGTCDTLGTAYQVAAAGNFAYVTEWTTGLEVIDISNPACPVAVGLCDTPGGAWGIFLAGNYAYVADAETGLQVIDVSNPAAPVIVGTCDTPYSAFSVAVAGSFAYVTEGDYGIEVIDVSNFTEPTIVASCVTTGTSRNVVLSGNYAYVTQGLSGLDVITAYSTTPGYTVLGRFHEQIGNPYGPGDLAYDEATDVLWASDIVEKKIRKIDPSTGSVLTTLNVSYNELPLGLTYRNGYLWNSDQWALPDGLIHKVDPVDGSSVHSITGLGGLTFDHRGWLWCTNWVSELSALDTDDGSTLDTITLPGFDPDYDQTLGLAFDEGTQTLWVSVVTNAWGTPGGGPQTNFLLHVALDGTVLSTDVFDPDPTLDGYQLIGLAFDNNNNILWATYSLFDRPPTSDDTYIYRLAVGEQSGTPIIDRIRGVKEPGRVIRIIGSGFGDAQGDSEVHIGPKVYGPGNTKIKLWTDTMIKVKLLNYKCAWFQGKDFRRRKIWVMVSGEDGVSSNVKSFKVFKPDTCP